MANGNDPEPKQGNGNDPEPKGGEPKGTPSDEQKMKRLEQQVEALKTQLSEAQQQVTDLTDNAKAHAYSNGCLKNGTRVTVLQTSGNWARIPSGWVCMDYLKAA